MADTLYGRIADGLARQIETGVYQAGERLPSIRDAKVQFAVSISTIQQAYAELESRGLVESRPQSGYYVTRSRNPGPPSGTERATERVAPGLLPVDVNQGIFHFFNRASQPARINFATGYPDIAFLPVAHMQKLLREISRQHMKDILCPEAAPAIEHFLCRQLSKLMARAGCETAQEDIVITAGCKDALSLCLASVASRGDTIAVETPTFPGFLQIIELLGMKALEIPTDPEAGISLAALELALEQWPVKACALVPTFNNPLGFSMERDRRRELLEILRRHEIPLIEDDLFGDTNHGGLRPAACKAYDTDGLVMYCSSVSKSLGGGLRVGWACPGRYTEEVRRRRALRGVSGSVLNQMLVAEYLESGRYERHLRKLCRHYARNTERMVKAIRERFPEGSQVRQPDGGYMVWVSLPGRVDSWEIYRQVSAKQISLMPGVLFSATSRYTNYLRLSAAMPWSHEVDMALTHLGEMVDALLPS